MELHGLTVELAHVNVRKQIVEDAESKKLAVDLKMQVKPLLTEFEAVLRSVLKFVTSAPVKQMDWLLANNHGFGDQTFRAEFDGHNIEVIRPIEGINEPDGEKAGLLLATLHHCKVNAFKMDWTALNFTFRVQVIVTEEQLGRIGGALEDELRLNIDSNSQEIVTDEEQQQQEDA